VTLCSGVVGDLLTLLDRDDSHDDDDEQLVLVALDLKYTRNSITLTVINTSLDIKLS